MLCLVMENIHSKGSADGAETAGRDEKSPLRDPSSAFPGQLFIVAHQQEADQVCYEKCGSRNDQFHVSITSQTKSSNGNAIASRAIIAWNKGKCTEKSVKNTGNADCTYRIHISESSGNAFSFAEGRD